MTTTTPPFAEKDNEFIAWYPLTLSTDQVAALEQPRSAGYYVHIPFCTAICDYCGFAVQRLRDGHVDRYVSALLREIDACAASGRLSQYRFVCGHFGGGTPSVLAAATFARIQSALAQGMDLAPGAEITVEVNPISFDSDKAAAYRDCGVNRISFGLQSFSDVVLKTIGRPHRATDTLKTLDIIRRGGFINFSLDLIYGVPGQTLPMLDEDLERAVATGATHISTFRLEIIPFTVLKFRESVGELPPRCPRSLLDEMDERVADHLVAAGYRHYGAFNFAKPGYESVHNRIAFMAPQGEYIGFGNSAYSYFDGHIAYNHHDVDAYVEAVEQGRRPLAKAGRVTALDAMARYFVLGLKFFEVSRQRFVETFGLAPEAVFGETLNTLQARGLLHSQGDMISLTPLGCRYVNNVAKMFYRGDSVGRSQYSEFVPTVTEHQIAHFSKRLEAKGEATRSRLSGLG